MNRLMIFKHPFEITFVTTFFFSLPKTIEKKKKT